LAVFSGKKPAAEEDGISVESRRCVSCAMQGWLIAASTISEMALLEKAFMARYSPFSTYFYLT
jgi:hypothetical protein